MDVEIPADLIEIHDPEIDPAQIMAQIRERIHRRREELGYDQRTFPSFDVTLCPEEPQDLPSDPNLYHHLRLANDLYAQIEPDPALPPSSFTRLPVLGRLWQRLRPALHTLILYYVNRAVAQQIAVNRHLVSALNQLTSLAQDQQRLIQTLQAEVEALRRERGA